MRKLIFTEAAVEDLRCIAAYTREKWGEEQEVKYLQNMWNCFETIRGEPSRYRSREDLFPGCRLAVEGRHAILFRASSEAFQVVRVLHTAMDFKHHLPPVSPDHNI